VEVGEDLPDDRLQLRAEQEQNRTVTTEQTESGRAKNRSSASHRANLRVGILERSVGGHMFDDVSQNCVDLAFLRVRRRVSKHEEELENGSFSPLLMDKKAASYSQ